MYCESSHIIENVKRIYVNDNEIMTMKLFYLDTEYENGIATIAEQFILI